MPDSEPMTAREAALEAAVREVLDKMRKDRAAWDIAQEPGGPEQEWIDQLAAALEDPPAPQIRWHSPNPERVAW